VSRVAQVGGDGRVVPVHLQPHQDAAGVLLAATDLGDVLCGVADRKLLVGGVDELDVVNEMVMPDSEVSR